MTEMVTSGSMSGERKRSDGLLGESDHERRRSHQAPPVLHTTASLLDSTPDNYSAAELFSAIEIFEGLWSRRADLNRGPADYESAALPTELRRPGGSARQ